MMKTNFCRPRSGLWSISSHPLNCMTYYVSSGVLCSKWSENDTFGPGGKTDISYVWTTLFSLHFIDAENGLFYTRVIKKYI